jgi:hypothetical protein
MAVAGASTKPRLCPTVAAGVAFLKQDFCFFGVAFQASIAALESQTVQETQRQREEIEDLQDALRSSQRETALLLECRLSDQPLSIQNQALQR